LVQNVNLNENYHRHLFSVVLFIKHTPNFVSLSYNVLSGGNCVFELSVGTNARQNHTQTCQYPSLCSCSCWPDPSHSSSPNHDPGRPGGHPHAGARGGQPDDPAGPSALCGQHSLWNHRGKGRCTCGAVSVNILKCWLFNFKTPIPSLSTTIPIAENAPLLCAGVYDGFLQRSDASGWSHSGPRESCPCCPDQPGQELCLP